MPVVKGDIYMTTTSSQVHLTLDTQHFIDELTAKNGPPLYTLSPEAARHVLLDAQSGTAPTLETDNEDLELEIGPTNTVTVRITRPRNCNKPLPILFYIHGGGWILGDMNTHDRLVRELAVGAQAAVVFPNYTPSPEACYPVPTEQIYAVLDHVTKNGERFGLDTSRLVVAGDSVGGNMATVMTLLAKERGGPKIDFQLLLYPVTDADFDTPSYRTFAEGPWLTREAMKWFWNAYAPDATRRKEITASPLRATLEQLRGLPPALIITDENDVLRDEGEAYARKLVAAGVRVTSVRYNGTIHDFMMLNALADTAPAKAATQQAILFLKDIFGA